MLEREMEEHQDLSKNVGKNTPKNTPDTDLDHLREQLIHRVYLELEEKVLKSATQFSGFIPNRITSIYNEMAIKLSETQREKLLNDVSKHFESFGPIAQLIDDPSISEIMVNGPKQIFIERNGELIETNLQFENEAHVIAVINYILKPLGRFVDYDHPTVDARLADGSRVNIVIQPVAHKGPIISIRKFLKDKLTIEQIIALGTLTESMAEFLHACVASRLNTIVSGNTSSGKTTLLNILSRFIPNNERIITIEDSAELNLPQNHVVSLEMKPANPQGEGLVTIRDLVRNSLRMRPDRIIVGECRGSEALDMLQAMNTGHEGSLTTVHSNSPRDTISRIETMALMSGLELPVRAIRHQIASAVHLIVHAMRLSDGTRKITSLCEVVGMEGEVVVLMDLFRFTQTGVDANGKILGDIQPTGLRPQFTRNLEAYGYKLPPKIFIPVKG